MALYYVIIQEAAVRTSHGDCVIRKRINVSASAGKVVRWSPQVEKSRRAPSALADGVELDCHSHHMSLGARTLYPSTEDDVSPCLLCLSKSSKLI